MRRGKFTSATLAVAFLFEGNYLFVLNYEMRGANKMPIFHITYYLNGHTVQQKVEAESSKQVRANQIIKKSQWIKDSKGHDAYIKLDKIDLITINPQTRAKAKIE
jgi:predicted membrane protein